MNLFKRRKHPANRRRFVPGINGCLLETLERRVLLSAAPLAIISNAGPDKADLPSNGGFVTEAFTIWNVSTHDIHLANQSVSFKAENLSVDTASLAISTDTAPFLADSFDTFTTHGPQVGPIVSGKGTASDDLSNQFLVNPTIGAGQSVTFIIRLAVSGPIDPTKSASLSFVYQAEDSTLTLDSSTREKDFDDFHVHDVALTTYDDIVVPTHHSDHDHDYDHDDCD